MITSVHKHRRQQSFQLAFFSASFEGKYVLYRSGLNMHFNNHKMKREKSPLTTWKAKEKKNRFVLHFLRLNREKLG